MKDIFRGWAEGWVVKSAGGFYFIFFPHICFLFCVTKDMWAYGNALARPMAGRGTTRRILDFSPSNMNGLRENPSIDRKDAGPA